MHNPFNRFHLILAAGLTAWACGSDSTGPTGVQTVKPNPITMHLVSLDCAFAGSSGGIVGVTVSPKNIVLYRSTHTHVDITGFVWRDDPNTPGVQFYCFDRTVKVNFTYWNLALSQPYGTDRLQQTTAQPGNLIGGTFGTSIITGAHVGSDGHNKVDTTFADTRWGP